MNKHFMRALTERLRKLPDNTGALDGETLGDVLSEAGLPDGADVDFLDEVVKIVEETIEEYSFSYNDKAMTTASMTVSCHECGINHGKWQSKFGSDMDNIDLIRDQRKILPL